jgi:cytochrome c556
MAKDRKPRPVTRGKSGADAIRKDAQGQFAQSQADPDSNGVASADPVVTSGDDDATFKHHDRGPGHGK